MSVSRVASLPRAPNHHPAVHAVRLTPGSLPENFDDMGMLAVAARACCLTRFARFKALDPYWMPRTGRPSVIGPSSESDGRGLKVAEGDITTYNERGVWKSKVEGSSRAAQAGGTKAEQQAVGQQMTQERAVEHTINKHDGTIGEKNSYGNDPHPPTG
jgi:hypothetical protein